jgi:hypothetical protein
VRCCIRAICGHTRYPFQVIMWPTSLPWRSPLVRGYVPTSSAQLVGAARVTYGTSNQAVPPVPRYPRGFAGSTLYFVHITLYSVPCTLLHGNGVLLVPFNPWIPLAHPVFSHSPLPFLASPFAPPTTTHSLAHSTRKNHPPSQPIFLPDRPSLTAKAFTYTTSNRTPSPCYRQFRAR